jgi:hypothetical protein
MEIQATLKVNLTTVRMTIIKKTTINARQDGEKGTLIHHWSEYK